MPHARARAGRCASGLRIGIRMGFRIVIHVDLRIGIRIGMRINIHTGVCIRERAILRDFQIYCMRFAVGYGAHTRTRCTVVCT